MRYTVTQIHQVTEVYEVEATSREEAWAKVTDHRPLRDDPQEVRLVRTDHGKREVWEVKRAVDDVALPPGPAWLADAGPCRTCGTPISTCMTVEPLVCCGSCQHPSL